MKKTIRIFTGCVALVCAGILGAIVYWSVRLPDSYQVEEGSALYVDETISLSANLQTDQAVARSLDASVGDTYPLKLHLLGVFPIKDVRLRGSLGKSAALSPFRRQ